MVHHAIVVTSWNSELIRTARAKAMELFGDLGGFTSRELVLVSEIVPSPINGYYSFLVAPDGSKDGWSESDSGDRARESLLRWIDSRAYEDGSNALKWVECAYGDVDEPTIRGNSE